MMAFVLGFATVFALSISAVHTVLPTTPRLVESAWRRYVSRRTTDMSHTVLIFGVL